MNIGIVGEKVLAQQAEFGCPIAPSLPCCLVCSSVLEYDSNFGKQRIILATEMKVHTTIHHMKASWLEEAFD